jgi:mono/diheme cytochrome c family protein
MLLLVWGASAEAAGDAKDGRRVAEKWCARCHVIGADKPAGGIESTPSFFLMHDKLDAYRERIRTFDERRPHKALEFDVDADAREDLITYIGVLERP